MMLKKEKISGDIERKVVIGAVMSSAVCKILSENYERGLIPSKAVSYVVETCVEYYSKAGAAPSSLVQELFEVDVARGAINPDTQDLTESLLDSCSKQFEREEEFNHQYYADLTREYISGRKLLKLSGDLKSNVEKGRVEEAEKQLNTYQGTALTSMEVSNPFLDPDLIQASFDQAENPLIRFRGAYGEMVNDLLVRDTFMSIMGPEKRGKTWQLIEFAIAGLKARRNVAFFSLGDMTKEQLSLRMAIRLTGISNKRKYCGEHWEPVLDCVYNQDDSCEKKCRTCSVGLGIEEEAFKSGDFDHSEAHPKYKPCTACSDLQGAFWYKKIKRREPLEWRTAYKALNQFYSHWMKGKSFRMCCVPAGSLSITGIDRELQRWSKGEDPFIPDIIITDYIDIAAPEPSGFKEFRHSENEKWKAGRKLSQTWHALHITATQSDAASYSTNTMSEENFSEDKRKYGHVNGGILGLNQTRQEKRLSLMRINLMFAREEEFHVDRTCTQLQNLRRGRAHLDSFWT